MGITDWKDIQVQLHGFLVPLSLEGISHYQAISMAVPLQVLHHSHGQVLPRETLLSLHCCVVILCNGLCQILSFASCSIHGQCHQLKCFYHVMIILQTFLLHMVAILVKNIGVCMMKYNQNACTSHIM